MQYSSSSSTTRPLNPGQVHDFDHDGYLAPIDILSVEEARDYRNRLEQYEKELGHPVRGPLRTKPHLLFKWVDNLMRDPRVLDPVEDLIGADIQCWNSLFWIKEATDAMREMLFKEADKVRLPI